MPFPLELVTSSPQRPEDPSPEVSPGLETPFLLNLCSEHPFHLPTSSFFFGVFSRVYWALFPPFSYRKPPVDDVPPPQFSRILPPIASASPKTVFHGPVLIPLPERHSPFPNASQHDWNTPPALLYQQQCNFQTFAFVVEAFRPSF